jgi:GT2 family glycosyltransferase
MADSTLSATVVTYRPDAALLARALASLAAAVAHAREQHMLGPVRLFVVDNGPEGAHDALREALLAWPAQAGSLEVVAGHGNVGYGRANNLVLDRLDSDFHLVMNPDVELDRAALAAGLAALREHPDVGLVAPDARGDDGARQYLCKRYPSLWVLFLRGFAPERVRRRFARALAEYEMRDVIGEQTVRGVPLASGCFMLLRTPLFRRLGGFDPRFFLYFEDYDLSLRVGREASVAYVPQARIVHHGGEAAGKGVRHIAWFVRSAWRFFATHGWKVA